MVIRVPDQRTARGGYAALDDRMLVLDFQAGQVEAFVEIHRRYGGLARHVCNRFLPNQADVDEAFQETMIRVFQGLYRFNGRYALRPWIARIAKNVSLDILRGRARRPQEDDAPLDEGLADPNVEADLIVERLVQRDAVLEILSDLPETHRRALVLREIDGRSHREIAKEMEISPAQAKALIHRAKGSFRKGWLEKVIGDGGVRAIAFLPLLWLARVGGGVRRVGDRFVQSVGHATQAAQAAAPEALTSAVSSAAPASASLSERVVAAGMTLLVAGGVTVGAAKIVQDRSGPEPAQVAQAAAVVAEASGGEAAPVEEVVQPAEDPRSERDVVEVAPVVEPSPSPDPELVVDPSPVPSPTEAPPPDPSPTEEPPPPPPPAPPWSASFGSSVPIGAAQLDLISSHVAGSAGGTVVFSQTVAGPLSDEEGNTVGRLYIEYFGAAEGPDGSVTFWIFLDTEAGRYRYEASGSLTAIVLGEVGDSSYLFSGAYRLVEWPVTGDGSPATEQVPQDGTVGLTLRFWADGTSIYGAELTLDERPEA